MKPLKKWTVIWFDSPDAIGTEIRKDRPAIVVSSNEIHLKLKRATVIPLTSSIRDFFPSRLEITLDGRTSLAMLDQIQTIDLSRITKLVGPLPTHYQPQVLKALAEYFEHP